jgi:hypothetical protein
MPDKDYLFQNGTFSNNQGEEPFSREEAEIFSLGRIKCHEVIQNLPGGLVGAGVGNGVGSGVGGTVGLGVGAAVGGTVG